MVGDLKSRSASHEVFLFAAILLVAFLLTACAGSKDEEEEKAKKPIPICPQVAILRDLEVMKDYGREKPDPVQLVAQAKLMSIRGDCEYKKAGIDVNFSVAMIAQRGPRLGGLHTEFPFFAAVIDPDQNILNKENLTAIFGFSSNRQWADDEESLHVFIPVTKDKQDAGPNYRVLVGFQLPGESHENSSP